MAARLTREVAESRSFVTGAGIADVERAFTEIWRVYDVPAVRVVAPTYRWTVDRSGAPRQLRFRAQHDSVPRMSTFATLSAVDGGTEVTWARSLRTLTPGSRPVVRWFWRNNFAMWQERLEAEVIRQTVTTTSSPDVPGVA